MPPESRRDSTVIVIVYTTVSTRAHGSGRCGEIFHFRSNGGKTNAPHSPPPPKNNMFHNRYEVLVRSTAVSPLHSGGAMIMNAR